MNECEHEHIEAENHRNINVLSHCNRVISNKDTENIDDVCWCMLGTRGINCELDNEQMNNRNEKNHKKGYKNLTKQSQTENVSIYTQKFHFPREYHDYSYPDDRTEAEIIKDIYMICSGFYPTEFKKLVDNTIGYDSETKLVKAGVYKSEKQMKTLRKQFKKLEIDNKNKGILKELRDGVSIHDKDHPLYSFQPQFKQDVDSKGTSKDNDLLEIPQNLMVTPQDSHNSEGPESVDNHPDHGNSHELLKDPQNLMVTPAQNSQKSQRPLSANYQPGPSKVQSNKEKKDSSFPDIITQFEINGKQKYTGSQQQVKDNELIKIPESTQQSTNTTTTPQHQPSSEQTITQQALHHTSSHEPTNNDTIIKAQADNKTAKIDNSLQKVNEPDNEPSLNSKIPTIKSFDTYILPSQIYTLRNNIEKQTNTVKINLNRDKNRSLIYIPVTLANDENTIAFPTYFIYDTGCNFMTIGYSHFLQLGLTDKDLKNKNQLKLVTTANDNKPTDDIMGTVRIHLTLKSVDGTYHPISVEAAVLKHNIEYPLFDLTTAKYLNFQLNMNESEVNLGFYLPSTSLHYNTLTMIETTDDPTHNVTTYMDMYMYSSQIEEQNQNDHYSWDYLEEENCIMDEGTLEDIVYKKNKLIDEEDDDKTVEEYLTPNLENATREEQKQLKKLFKRYSRVFTTNKFAAGKYEGFKVPIHTIPGKIVRERPRNMDIEKIRHGEKLLQGLIKEGIVSEAPIDCEWSSNLLIQPKVKIKHNSKADKYNRKISQAKEPTSNRFRLLIDLRKLNEITKPVPRAKFENNVNTNSRLGGKFCAQFDVSNSFFSLQLQEKDRIKTAFHFNDRLYVLNRLPQGFVNSSYYQGKLFAETFSRENVESFKNSIDKTLDVEKFLNNCCHFSDDFIITSDTREEHLQHIHCMLYLLDKANLKINLTKVNLFATKFSYLNNTYNLEDRTLCLDKERVQGVLAWVTPGSLAHISSYLATLQYLSTNILNYKILAYPFYDMLRSKKFYWSKNMQKWFNNLKYAVSLNISLALPDKTKPVMIANDASTVGASSCYLQYDKEIEDFQLVSIHSILFSKQLARRYVLHKELSILASSIERFEDLIAQQEAFICIACDVLSILFARGAKSRNSSINNISLLLSNYPKINLLSMSSASNFCADLYSRIFHRKVKLQDTAHTVTTNLTNRITKDVQFVNYDELMTFLWEDLDTYHDCREKADEYERNEATMKLDDVTRIFRECTREKEWIKLSKMDANILLKKHSLWTEMLNKDAPTATDIKKLVTKHQLDKVDLSAFIYNTVLAPAITNEVTEKERKEETEKRKEDNSNKDEACILFFPDEAKFFIECAREIMQNDKTGRYRHILRDIKVYDHLSLKTKYKMLLECKSNVEKLLNRKIDHLPEFVMPITYALHPQSKINLKQGDNCLKVYLKEDTEIKGLLLLELGLIILQKSKILYFSPAEQISDLIYNQPSSTFINHHYFNSLYLYSKHKTKLASAKPIFYIYGFQPDYKIKTLQSPIRIECKHPESPCEINWTDTYRMIVYKCIPMEINNSMTKQLFNTYATDYKIQNHFADYIEIAAQNFNQQELNIQNNMMELRSKKRKEEQKQQDEIVERKAEKKENKKNPEYNVDQNTLTTWTGTNNILDNINSIAFVHQVMKNKLTHKSLLKLLFSDIQYRNLYTNVEKFPNQHKEFHFVNGFLFRKYKDEDTKMEYQQLVVNIALARLLVGYYHNFLLFHTANSSLLKLFLQQFWLPHIKNVIKEITETCLACTLSAAPQIKKQKEVDGRTITASRPGEVFLIDAAHQLPPTHDGYNHLLIIVDMYSSFLMTVALKTLESSEMTDAMMKVFQFTGPCSVLLSDYSTSYQKSFEIMLAKLQVRHVKRTPGKSEELGAAESAVKEAKRYLTKYITNGHILERRNWNRYLPWLSINHNSLCASDSKVPRATLFRGSKYYNSFSNQFLQPEHDEDAISAYQYQRQEQRRYKQGIPSENRKFFPGNFCKYITKNKDKKVVEGSRYLQPSMENVFIILGIAHKTAYVRSIESSETKPVPLSQLRKLTFNELQNLTIAPSSLDSVVKQNRSHPSSPSFLDNDNLNIHSLKTSKKFRKMIKDVLNMNNEEIKKQEQEMIKYEIENPHLYQMSGHEDNQITGSNDQLT